MPWLIEVTDDGTNHFVWGSSPFERVVTADHDVLQHLPGHQFGKPNAKGNPTIPDTKNEFDFLRAEYEYGRCFYHLKRERKTIPARAQPRWYCDRFKRILEELEPGKHRFARIDIRMPDKVTPWPEPYWFWRCENFVESIIPDIGDGDPQRSLGYYWVNYKTAMTDVWTWGNSKGNSLAGSGHRPIPLTQRRPVVNASAISVVHAWRDTGFLTPHHVQIVFLSDVFVERLRAVNAVKGLELGEIMTSEVSASRRWIEEPRRWQ